MCVNMKLEAFACWAVVIFGALTCTQAKLPAYFRVCSRNHPNFKECATKNGQIVAPKIVHGDRKYRIPNLDPLEITEMGLDVSGLHLKLKDVRVYGGVNATVREFNVDFDKRVLSYVLYYPTCVVLSNYSVNGRISILPISGEGTSNITLDNMVGMFTLKYDLVTKKNGHQYMVMKEPHLDLTVTRMYIKLDNLFNGNKLLGDQVHLFLDENWKELLDDFGPTIGEGISVAIARVFSLLEMHPYDEVFPKE